MRAAASAAAPFRSVAAEAAVAEVLGTLPVLVALILTAIEIDLQLLGDDLGDLGHQPLAHLRAAVVQVHAAIGVDVQQRAGLVEVGHGERDAELDRGEREAALEHGFAALKVAISLRRLR